VTKPCPGGSSEDDRAEKTTAKKTSQKDTGEEDTGQGGLKVLIGPA
jgi:hypothetical protein